MRSGFLKKRNITASVIGLLMIALCLALPCDSFADDGDTQLAERNVHFTYRFTECVNMVRTVTDKDAVSMMLCDTDHFVRIEGDGITDENYNVTFTSSDPDVLNVDDAGNVTLEEPGTAVITATVAADDAYAECSKDLTVTVDRHYGWKSTSQPHFWGDDLSWPSILETTGYPKRLVVLLRPGASISGFSSTRPEVAGVDENGKVTPISPGKTEIRIDVDDGGGRYKPGTLYREVTVSGSDTRTPQEISGDKGPFTIDWHDGLQLDLQAPNGIEYSLVSGTNVSVSQTGFVKFKKKGSAVIKAAAAGSVEYQPAEITIKITARDFAADEAAAAEAAALKREIARAKSLKRPTLRASALSGRKIKLTWGKVRYADGYILYVRYPGSKKYVRAVKKKATVKSVTHRGLTRYRVYRYKVRAYKKVNGKTYYGPYSVVRKARVR